MSTLGKTGKASKRQRASAGAWEEMRADTRQLHHERLSLLMDRLEELDGLIATVTAGGSIPLLILTETALASLTTMADTLRALTGGTGRSTDPAEPVDTALDQETPGPASSPGPCSNTCGG